MRLHLFCRPGKKLARASFATLYVENGIGEWREIFALSNGAPSLPLFSIF
jgi:hypothetical protein